ncbi:hypothetical protein EDD16DRAFT_972846 [Pisolithus croceorrhizus]|nr:hypothetical protein EDD16DRAFT_972846 [Pisolithus croceorrhizus]
MPSKDGSVSTPYQEAPCCQLTRSRVRSSAPFALFHYRTSSTAIRRLPPGNSTSTALHHRMTMAPGYFSALWNSLRRTAWPLKSGTVAQTGCSCSPLGNLQDPVTAPIEGIPTVETTYHLNPRGSWSPSSGMVTQAGMRNINEELHFCTDYALLAYNMEDSVTAEGTYHLNPLASQPLSSGIVVQTDSDSVTTSTEGIPTAGTCFTYGMWLSLI